MSILRDIVAIAGANASVKYEFTDGRGVLVGAIQMKGRYLEFEDIRRIMEDPRMKVDKVRFVTQVWEAPAYVTYMSDKSETSTLFTTLAFLTTHFQNTSWW